MGFVVKSKNHTIGFDIFPSMVGNVEIISLADDLDILFLSHAHSDHVYPPLVEAMVKAGKKVVIARLYSADQARPRHSRT